MRSYVKAFSSRLILFLFAVSLPGLGLAAATAPDFPALGEYAGSEKCGQCHRSHHEAWEQTYHKNVVRNAKESPDAIIAHFSERIEGFGREDVEYVIGGHWYQRFMVKMGDDYYMLPKIWSVASHKWDPVDVASWKRKPYSKQCKGCHATRYDPALRVEVEHQIGCEACHGPGNAHARSGGAEKILNPSSLSPDDADLICASCHVRGRDRTGKYPFAVGFVPGRNLTDYYTPLAVLDGETPRETFLRTFREWKERLGKGKPPACDVCGIKRSHKDERVLTTSEECQQCHAFKDDGNSHVSHPGEIKLECLDCHRAMTRTVADAGDIHSPDTFKVHREQGFEKEEAELICQNCHND